MFEKKQRIQAKNKTSQICRNQTIKTLKIAYILCLIVCFRPFRVANSARLFVTRTIFGLIQLKSTAFPIFDDRFHRILHSFATKYSFCADEMQTMDKRDVKRLKDLIILLIFILGKNEHRKTV